MAHAIGNVPLKLNEWNVDFAIWCSYKYLSGGPGAIGGIFLHRHHHKNQNLFFLEGWWGNKLKSRFDMDLTFDPYEGAKRLQLSNSCPLSMVCLLASLQIFNKTTIQELRRKSWNLSQYFRKLLKTEEEILKKDQRNDRMENVQKIKENTKEIIIITPELFEESGAQLSIYSPHNNCHQIHDHLVSKGIIGDLRNPNVIRFALSGFNTFQEIHSLAMELKFFIK